MRKSLSDTPGGEGDELVVEVGGLVKHFGKVVALDGLDLQIRRHEVHGFLGPNGAGKSTTIRVLLGQLRADAGTAVVLGMDPWRDAVTVHDRLAYVPGDVTLWPGLTGGECIDVLGSFSGHQSRARRDELVERFELDPTRNTRSYSKGNRQKVALIAALAADVELLLLDEPTAGLDPLMEAEFQLVIREATAEGRTVLLSSHILAEVEQLCDRVSIVRNGVIVREGTLAQLRASTATTVEASTRHTITGLSEQAGVHNVREHPLPDGGVRTTITVSPDALAAILGRVLAQHPTALTVAPPTLDELFLNEYRGAAAP